MAVSASVPSEAAEANPRDLAEPRQSPRRPILESTEPQGFRRYPYYTVGEVARILGVSDDCVRTLFRRGKQGPVLEVFNAKPGRRTYRTVLIPYRTLTTFIRKFTREEEAGRRT